jgi:signal transduction histidine kinase
MAERTQSLAIGVAAVVLAVVLAPLVLVAVLDVLFDRARPDVGQATERAAAEAAELPADDARLDAIAAQHEVDLRVFADVEIARFRHSPESENALGVASIAPDAEPPDEDPLDRELAAARRGEYLHACEAIDGGRRLRCRTARSRRDGTIVVAERSAVRSLERLTDVGWPMLVLSAFTLVLGVALAAWLVFRLVAPLSRLRAAVLSRKSSPSARVRIEGPREIRDVAKAFDEVLASLARERRERERLVADLAHELKSPLASLRTSVDVLAGAEPSPDRREELRVAAERNVRRIDETLAQLLELARAESGLPNEERAGVDLAELVTGTVEAFRVEHPTAPPIELDAQPAPVHAAPNALARALRAVLENAAAHAKSRIAVRVLASGAVEIADDGPGLADVERAFERFHSRREGGTGLGLALVSAVATAHGGRATARNERGAVVRIELPLRDS